jgi:hypothetical protein
MKNNYYFPILLMIGMLFTGFSSFSQSINSLNPQKRKMLLTCSNNKN